ncbi:MAG: tRNA pseudouridine(38-40) synthase TruA [Planctomycetaceae bacterium]|jgi:tRNA pseudouridine38-40 synthase|nr:tRNA pseudouridine(38-40) synthase TruA [Planctomycetaceae bacterium]
MGMRQILLEIAYQGTGYSGWARQQNVPTIQGTLEDALEKVVRQRLEVFGSSRTDAGVHALGQLAVFMTESRIPADKFVRAINYYLPDDIRILRAEEYPLDFLPLKHVWRKKYLYLIDDASIPSPFLKNRVWLTGTGTLDTEKMHLAAQHLAGTHDFAGFQSQGSPRLSTVRTVFHISVRRLAKDGEKGDGLSDRPLILFEVEGDGFLYNMVRIIVGTLVETGWGKRSPDGIRDVLLAKKRSHAGLTAPPEGLYLKKIDFRP